VMQDATFQWNYTTWLDLFTFAALALLFLATLGPKHRHGHAPSHQHDATGSAHHAHH
jgi:hypothetical protein